MRVIKIFLKEAYKKATLAAYTVKRKLKGVVIHENLKLQKL